MKEFGNYSNIKILHKTTRCFLIECQKNKEKTLYLNDGQRQEDTISFPYGLVRNGNDEIKIKIGHEAERAYSVRAKRQRITNELVGHCYFFSRFKLQLYNTGFHREQLVEDQIRQQLPLFDVMSFFIKALKDHCLKKLETSGKNVELSKTLFVVTVPAIWSDEAKKFMRDATVQVTKII
ncbi:uncharacterized protein LOC128554137 [Mercenaria mercenaria]|uniref:uncharacterized protein LOC128554137 n=1 Tax=Mercenaria mercenaria TaxID=6596 RepID=UPI00234E8A9F|nr:uncharacterized protein LOC128554137 [Mercenaria mercenaria]